MPPVIFQVVFFIAKTLAIDGFGAFLLRIAGAALLNVITSKLFGPKAPPGVGLGSVQVMTRSAIEYRKIVYGQAMVSGPLWYNNLSGSNGEFIWYGIALAEGASEDLISVWLDGDEILKADIAWTAGTGSADGTGSGNVTTSKWVGAGSTTAVQIYYYLGDDAQPVPGALNTAFNDIGANHRLRGVTHIVLKFLYDTDTETVWKGGAPSNISAVMRGRKTYDPRLDSTNGGTGSHRYTDSSTWAWSDNPSLCVADYLMNVMLVDAATSINWTSVASAADDCDVLVAVPTASTEKRFTCNGALSLGSSHKDNLDSILSSMDGKLSYSAGVWKLRASVWEASSVTFGEDDLAGGVEVRGSAPKSERFNGVRGFFVDPTRNYEASEFTPVSSTTYLARDNNEVINYDLQLPMTNSGIMAQRVAFRNLEQGDNQTVVKLKTNARGAKAEIGDVVALDLPSYGWTGGSVKTFRCIGWARNPESTFSLTLKEDESSDYADPLESEYSTTAASNVTVPSDVIPTPGNLTATGAFGGVDLAWDEIPSRLFDHIEIWMSDDNDRANASIIATPSNSPYHDNVTSALRERFYWIRARNFSDNVSDYEPNTIGTTARAYPFVQQQSMLADPFIRQGASFWDLSDANASYSSDTGTDSTDTVRLSPDSLGAAVSAAARRGPREWDYLSSGIMAVEVRYRISLATDPGGSWAQVVFPRVIITDGNQANQSTYNGLAGRLFGNGDATGVWFDETAVIEISDTGLPPRFIQVGLFTVNNLLGPVFAIDFIDASPAGIAFAGVGKPGLVPAPSVEQGYLLDDAGAWVEVDPTKSEINTRNGNYTLVLSDAGKTIYKASGGSGETYTIPANSSVAFNVGTIVRVDNDGGGDLSIAITSDTCVGPDGATATKVLADNETAILRKITSTRWRYEPGDNSFKSDINTRNGNYTLVLADAGRTIYKASGGGGETYTIPANSSTAFKLGTMIGIDNDGGGDLSIAITTDTLVGTDGTTGTKTLGDNETAVIKKLTATRWRYAASDL